MKYKMINENIKNKSLLEVVYENRGITKEMVERLLNANSEEYRNPFEIFGMDEAVKQFKKEVEKNSKIGILCDSDCDGFTSATIFYNFLINDIKYDKENIKVFIHTEKQHGINSPIFKDIKKSDIEYLIIPDAGTNDLHQMKILNENNIKILCLDHHLCEISLDDVPENTVIVNNQIKECESKFGSGALVTAKFIEAYGSSIEEYIDLIAVSLISDSMNLMLSLENRAYVNLGLKNIKNPLIKAYFNKNRVNKPVINDVSYNLANFVNAIIRVGTQEEKELMFRAFIGEEELFNYKKRTGEEVKETLQERVVRLSSNCKSRQNNAIKKSVEKCNNYITRKHLDNNKVIIIKNDDKFIEQSQTGLIAMKICDARKRPCIILNRLNEEYYSGSMRAIGIDNFKEILESTELFEWIKGHPNASGVNIKVENVDKLDSVLNEKLKDFQFYDGRIYDVDNIININELNKGEMKKIGELKNLWCSDIRQPLFAIKNIEIESINIKMVSKLRCEFKINGITFFKDWCSKDFYNSLILKDQLKFGKSQPLKISIVGKFVLDKYGNPMVEIVDVNSIKNTQNKIIF